MTGAVQRRRDILRGIRRLILALDPQTELRGFLGWAARHLVEHTGASACGVATRFPHSARDLFVLAAREAEPRRHVEPIRSAERVQPLPDPEGQGADRGFFYRGLGGLAAEAGVEPGRVVSAAIRSEDRVVAGIELVDPDETVIPDAATLEEFLVEVGPAFELAFLHAQLRRERLEARLLQQVSHELGRTLDLHELLGNILDLMSQVVPYDAAAIYLLGGGGLDVVDQSIRGYAEGQEEVVRLKLGQGIVGWAARTGEPEIVADVGADARYYNARPETRSEMVVPLKSGGRVIGVFNVEADRLNAYTPHDLGLLDGFGGHAATALERARLLEEEDAKRRLEQELLIARRIQRTFLPKPADQRRRPGLAGRTLPSEEVSGDYYDFLDRGDGSLALIVADVAGKGIPGALIMSSLRAAFHLTTTEDTNPADQCRELNTYLHASLRDTEFVTAVLAVLDAEYRSLWYCNAGHNPPVLLRADGEVEWLGTGGTILGAFPGVPFEWEEILLEEGDLVVLYTDGVTEAENAEEEQFENDRLVETIRAHAHEHPRRIAGAVINAVRSWVGGPLPDDLTVVVVAGGRGKGGA